MTYIATCDVYHTWQHNNCSTTVFVLPQSELKRAKWVRPYPLITAAERDVSSVMEGLRPGNRPLRLCIGALNNTEEIM